MKYASLLLLAAFLLISLPAHAEDFQATMGSRLPLEEGRAQTLATVIYPQHLGKTTLGKTVLGGSIQTYKEKKEDYRLQIYYPGGYPDGQDSFATTSGNTILFTPKDTHIVTEAEFKQMIQKSQ